MTRIDSDEIDFIKLILIKDKMICV